MTDTIMGKLAYSQRVALIDLDVADVMGELALRLGASLSGESGNPDRAISAINSELEEMGHPELKIATGC